jgi:hypothetical protein
MNIFKRTSIQNQLEQLLANQGELEKFNQSEIFRTSINDNSHPVVSIVKFHNIVTCYFVTERFGHIDDSPSITVSIDQIGQWRIIAKNHARTFSKVLKSA